MDKEVLVKFFLIFSRMPYKIILVDKIIISHICMLYCIDVCILHIVIAPFIISLTCLFDMLFSHDRKICVVKNKSNS